MRAFVEVDLDFETSSLHFGNIRKNEGAEKSASIVGKDLSDVTITGITPTSELITVVEGELTTEADNVDRIELKLTVSPGFPMGLFSESITVGLKRGSETKEVKLHLYGMLVEEVDFTPQVVVFNIRPTDSISIGLKKNLTLTNYSTDFALEILDVNDPDNRLDLSVSKNTRNKRFVVEAILKENVPKGTNLSGNIIVHTNNPDYEEVRIPYRISRPN